MKTLKIDRWYSWPQLLQTGKILLIYLLAFLVLLGIGMILYPNSKAPGCDPPDSPCY